MAAAALHLVCQPVHAAATPASGDPAGLCIAAARTAAAETGVPASVLVAITQAETGRGNDARPWPWTVNMEGEGRWFDDAAAARAFAEGRAAAGARSFDIGCFQINHRWHGQAFESIAAMFDPLENARYAARFLADLRVETGDWSLAAGAYHSRTPENAQRYRARFDRLHAAAQSGGADAAGPLLRLADAGASALPRVNRFPLLQGGQQRSALGSLVPVPASVRTGN